MQEALVKFTLIRLIAHRQIKPSLFINYRFMMRECVKADLAVIRAHSALSYTAKAHLACGKVDYHVVDTSAAVGKLCGDSLYMLFIACEEI